MTAQGMVATLSTVDFYGVFKKVIDNNIVGVPIAFDAKETQNKTSFPLANIHQHQVEYLRLWNKVGGTGFFLIHFTKLYKNEAFVTPLEFVYTYWSNPDGRKSIPISEFKKEWLTPIDTYLSYFIPKI